MDRLDGAAFPLNLSFDTTRGEEAREVIAVTLGRRPTRAQARWLAAALREISADGGAAPEPVGPKADVRESAVTSAPTADPQASDEDPLAWLYGDPTDDRPTPAEAPDSPAEPARQSWKNIVDEAFVKCPIAEVRWGERFGLSIGGVIAEVRTVNEAHFRTLLRCRVDAAFEKLAAGLEDPTAACELTGLSRLGPVRPALEAWLARCFLRGPRRAYGIAATGMELGMVEAVVVLAPGEADERPSPAFGDWVGAILTSPHERTVEREILFHEAECGCDPRSRAHALDQLEGETGSRFSEILARILEEAAGKDPDDFEEPSAARWLWHRAAELVVSIGSRGPATGRPWKDAPSKPTAEGMANERMASETERFRFSRAEPDSKWTRWGFIDRQGRVAIATRGGGAPRRRRPRTAFAYSP